MKLPKLTISIFKMLENIGLLIKSGLNLIMGDNGAGKRTILGA